MTNCFFFSVKPFANWDFLLVPNYWLELKEDYKHIRELVPYIRNRAKHIIDRCRNLLHIQFNYRLETKRVRTHMEK